MTSIIDLLTEKNTLLEKFYRLNEGALENFACADFDGLEDFYSTREGILQVIKKIDEKIDSMNDLVLDRSAIDNAMKKVILTALEYKNDLVNRILEQDLRILSAIETEKSTIIKELAQVRSAGKAIRAYAKNSVPAVEEK